MSAGPDPGTYSIISSELSPSGNQLSLNFIGRNTPLVVSEADPQFFSQRWVVQGESGTPQVLVPQLRNDLQVAPEGGYVEAVRASEYTWMIAPSPSGNGYTIRNTAGTEGMGLNRPNEGQQVSFQRVSDSALQVWGFSP